MGTRVVTQLVQEGVQMPGRCNRCYSEACGLEGGIVLEMNDDPWGDIQFGKRCIEEMAMEVGWKPPSIYEAAIDTASDLLTENARLRDERDSYKLQLAGFHAAVKHMQESQPA